jgi:hypothetical protein
MYAITNAECKLFLQLLTTLKESKTGTSIKEQNQLRIINKQIKKIKNKQQQPASRATKKQNNG